MLRLLYLMLLTLISVACGDKNTATEKGNQAQHDYNQESTKVEGLHFGVKKISVDGAVPVTEVLTRLETTDALQDVQIGSGELAMTVKGFPVKVEGQVAEVCRAEGCWFTFADESGKELFFNMKEHKNIPTDSKGKSLVVEGIAYLAVTSVDELKAAKREAGGTEDELAAITQAQKEYKFIADGVIVKK